MTVVSNPPYLPDLVSCNFCVSPIEDKTERRESLSVLNTLTEHDFQDAFKNGRSAGNGACTQKGTYLRMMMVSRPKISF
jgi:hypothetical protein